MKLKTRYTKSFVAGLIAAAATHAAATPMTRDNGAPIGDNQNSQTAGPNGPVLLQDGHLIQKLQRFSRERIPERVVHARGTGAYGTFEATRDIAHLTRAKVFVPGAKTPVFVRFSSVINGNHSPETLRDPRGFGTKFYTSEGNWDLVGNNLPVFFIRDAIKFPDMVHALKPAPDTNLQDPNRFFDFFSQQPEATHMLTQVFSDQGTPKNYRKMDGHSVHAFKFVNDKGEVHYVKFRWKSLQGQKSLNATEIQALQGKDFNHMTRDLIAAIDEGKHPKWDLYIQVLKPSELASFDFDALDPTKVWPNVSETKIGTMTLNKNPGSVFLETEQSALAPSNLIPGIEPSEDRLLKGRLFSYADAQLYRVGTNAHQLPVNRARVAVVNNHQDGNSNAAVNRGGVNYEPSHHSKMVVDAAAKSSRLPLQGTTQQQGIARAQNFKQAGEFYRSLAVQERANLVSNLSNELRQVKDDHVKYTMLSYFHKSDADYGRALTRATRADLSRVEALAKKLKE